MKDIDPELEDNLHAMTVLRRRHDARRRGEARENVRHEIDARRYVYQLDAISETLLAGRELVQDPITGQQTTIPLDKDRLAQLLGAAGIKQNLLKKVLPDIKAVELTGADGEDLGTDRVMATIELRNRLRAILRGDSLPSVMSEQVQLGVLQ